MDGTIIYLIGHYGVGKLTVACEICAETGARLVDNHLINNVIFSLLPNDGRTKLPERIWDLTWNVREQAVAAIAELAPTDESYVFTNALEEYDEMDRAAYRQVEDLCARRGSTFVPVMLSCSEEENLRRVASEERRANLKHTDVQSALQRMRSVVQLQVDHPNRLDLDTTELTAADAAKTIIAHAQGCMTWQKKPT